MGRDIPECRARIGGVDPAEARLAFRTAAPMVTLAPCMIWLSLSVVRDTCFLATRWLGAASPPLPKCPTGVQPVLRGGTQLTS